MKTAFKHAVRLAGFWGQRQATYAAPFGRDLANAAWDKRLSKDDFVVTQADASPLRPHSLDRKGFAFLPAAMGCRAFASRTCDTPMPRICLRPAATLS